jgi:hypothetical protein
VSCDAWKSVSVDEWNALEDRVRQAELRLEVAQLEKAAAHEAGRREGSTMSAKPKRMIVVKLPFLSESIDDVVVMYQGDFDRMVERERTAKLLAHAVLAGLPEASERASAFLAGEKGETSDGK